MNRVFSNYPLIAFVFIITLGISCETENNNITNVELLTNGSSKTWYLSKIVAIDGTTISPSFCIVDDEYKFQINGECLINNMGTIPAISLPPVRKIGLAFL